MIWVSSAASEPLDLQQGTHFSGPGFYIYKMCD